MTTPTDNPAARHQAHLETLENIADQVGAFELASSTGIPCGWARRSDSESVPGCQSSRSSWHTSLPSDGLISC